VGANGFKNFPRRFRTIENKEQNWRSSWHGTYWLKATPMYLAA
jgi:hypothetical protein